MGELLPGVARFGRSVALHLRLHVEDVLALDAAAGARRRRRGVVDGGLGRRRRGGGRATAGRRGGLGLRQRGPADPGGTQRQRRRGDEFKEP
jgi:hypothetical protein